MLYAITDRRLYADEECTRRQRLLELTTIWAAKGVAFIQLREKDLPARDQVELARAMLQILQSTPGCSARLLLNGRPDVALATGADGVHLPSGPEVLTPDEVRQIFSRAGQRSRPYISVSCHTLAEVAAARQQQADGILFAPVFEKRVASNDGCIQQLPGAGLERLREACQSAAPVPVFALGGVTAQNASECFEAGAAGIAAIRLMRQPAAVWLDLAP